MAKVLNARLIMAIFSGLLGQAIIVVVIIFVLPVLGLHIPLYGLIPICTAYAIYEVISFRMGSRILKRKPLPGLTTMVGIECKVVTRLAPEGFVRIKGELWHAIAENGNIDAGVDVLVVRQSGLKLVVCKK